MPVTIKVSNTRCQIDGLRPKDFKELDNLMSYDVDYQLLKASGFKIPPKVKLMTPKGTFWLGLLTDVRAWLKSKKIRFEVDDHRELPEPPTPEEFEKELRRLQFQPRPYQREGILRVLLSNTGIVQMATGGGKTIVLGSVISILDQNTLVLVNSKDLAYQLRREIAEVVGINENQIGIVGDGKFEPKKWTIALVQSLTNAKMAKPKKDAVKKLCQETELLFVDEAHHVQAATYKAVIRQCKNAHKRVGFTATPMTSKFTTMKRIKYTCPSTGQKKVRVEQEKATKEIVLKAYLGELLTAVTTVDLIKWGYLSKPSITFLQNRVYSGGGAQLPYVEEYDRCIVRDPERNKIICEIIKSHWEKDEQIIGFVTRIDHGETLRDMLIEMGIPSDHIAWVSGEDISSERNSSIAAFQEGHTPILLGTVLSEGLNFFCHAGINCSAGDSDIQAIQRLGRILRKPKSKGADVDIDLARGVKFYDFEDLGHKVFSRHGKNRFKLYKDEGHTIRIKKVDDLLS